MTLPTIPYDKALHVVYGLSLGTLGALCSFYFNADMWKGALMLCAFFAVFKEVYDYVSKKGTPDVMDTVATILGAVPLALIDWLNK